MAGIRLVAQRNWFVSAALSAYRAAVSASDFSVKPTLEGDKVRLEPLQRRHFDALWRAFHDPELRRLTGSHGAITAQRLETWIASRADTNDRLDLAIIAKSSGRCVGEAVLNEVDFDNRSCNFRILLGADGRGQGLGTEATRLIVGHGFESLAMHRISLGVFAFNPRAQRVYEKVGFVAEGVAREELWWDGQWHDSVNMAILEQEWRRHRGHPDSA